MPYTQSDLDKIDAAMLNPAKKVTFADGRSVENYDLDQMRRLRADVKAELASAASQVTPRTRFSVARFRRA